MLSTPTTPKSSQRTSLNLSSLSFPLFNTSTQPSSPLATPSPVSRRRAQYKSRTPSKPLFGSAGPATGRSSGIEEGADAFLRERFKKRCFERARVAREHSVRTRRRSTASEPSSDGPDEMMDYDNDNDDGSDNDEDVMQDELFRRIMANANNKSRHSYRLSYAHEVGSSLDPDMEDVSRWENELRSPSSRVEDVGEDDEEVAAYAEEYAALADFSSLPDELFELSESEAAELGITTTKDKRKGSGVEVENGDVDMML